MRAPFGDATNKANIEIPVPSTKGHVKDKIDRKERENRTIAREKENGTTTASPTPSAPGTNRNANNTRTSYSENPSPSEKPGSVPTSTAAPTTATTSARHKRKSHIGPWIIGHTLGKGATSRVRLVKHAVTGQTAAAKIISKREVSMTRSMSIMASESAAALRDGLVKEDDDDDDDDDQAANINSPDHMPSAIEREIAVMKLLSHPNITQLYDVWESHGEVYLILEYSREELFNYMYKHKKLSEHQAVLLFRQLNTAIAHIHARSICHRDLKLENILLGADMNVKVTDFGMAALLPEDGYLDTSCGSPHYAAPEIIMGERYRGDQADIWSCGIILFVLVAGYLPFDGDELNETLDAVVKGEFLTPPWMSREAIDLVKKILRRNPDSRISIADIFKHPLLKRYESSCPFPGSVPFINLQTGYDSTLLPTSSSVIEIDILRELCALWHGSSREEVIAKLLLDDANNTEKLFYVLLLIFKQDRIAEFHTTKRKYLKISFSDHHHISGGQGAAQLSTHSPRHLPSCKNGARRLYGPRNDVHRVNKAASSPPSQSRKKDRPKSHVSTVSYDPYRASQFPLRAPEPEYARVTVYRLMDEDRGIQEPAEKRPEEVGYHEYEDRPPVTDVEPHRHNRQRQPPMARRQRGPQQQSPAHVPRPALTVHKRRKSSGKANIVFPHADEFRRSSNGKRIVSSQRPFLLRNGDVIRQKKPMRAFSHEMAAASIERSGIKERQASETSDILVDNSSSPSARQSEINQGASKLEASSSVSVSPSPPPPDSSPSPCLRHHRRHKYTLYYDRAHARVSTRCERLIGSMNNGY